MYTACGLHVVTWLISLPISMLLSQAAHVWSDFEWNMWLVQLHISTFINWFCVRCVRHKQLCGSSHHWFAPDSRCALLPQWQTSGRKNTSFLQWLNICIMKNPIFVMSLFDFLILIILTDFSLDRRIVLFCGRDETGWISTYKSHRFFLDFFWIKSF